MQRAFYVNDKRIRILKVALAMAVVQDRAKAALGKGQIRAWFR